MDLHGGAEPHERKRLMVVAEKVGWVEVCHTTIRFLRGVTTANGRQYETRTRRQQRIRARKGRGESLAATVLW